MSNIKLIDSSFINLDNVTHIEIDSKYNSIAFYLNVYDSEGWQPRINSKQYDTREEAQARIKQILEKQNSKEIEI